MNLICWNLAAVGLIFFIAIGSVRAASASQAALKPVNLRCEYKANPLGIDIPHPRLSWIPQSIDPSARGLYQSAYQILVASSRQQLDHDQADLWDTGRVDSDQTIQIAYQGKLLASNQDAFWKVRIWSSRDAQPSAWSETAHWSSGLLQPSDWKARWIGYDAPADEADSIEDHALLSLHHLNWVWTDEGDATKAVPGGTRYFAKEIDVPSEIESAMFIGCADDNFNLAVNGHKAGGGGAHVRAYQLNLSGLLHPGRNMLMIDATNSGHNPAALIGRVVIHLAGGKSPLVVDIDKSWRFAIDKPAGWERGQPDLSKMKPAIEVVPVGSAPWGTPELRKLILPPPPYLRKSFKLDKPIKRAIIFATARGLYELHLHGHRVGDDYFTPGWTDYHKRIDYNTYDVTSMLNSESDNVIGAILGDGWHSGYFSYQGKRNLYGSDPRLLVQLEIEFADGSKQTLITDDSWRCAYGPYREADLLQGSAYDARREIPGWSTAGFDASAWKAPSIGEPTSALLQSYPGDPARKHEQIEAKKITEPVPGTYIFDLGQNMVGWVRLKVRNQPAGTKITLHHAEMLNPDGTPYLIALRQARAMDTYICKGGREEGFEPKFTFHGFRYVEVQGLAGKPSLDMITGQVVGASMDRTGVFECSDARVNQLFHNIIWGQKGNYLEVPTDCPQRDERLGWTGDAQFFIPTAASNFDIASFFTKWLIDLDTDAQYPDGSFADVAPDLLGGHGNVAWGDAGIICPYVIYRTYDDTRIIERHYTEMARYIDFLEKTSTDFLRGQGGYGDWLNLNDKTQSEVIGTAYFRYVTELMSEMASAIGKTEDAARYHALSQNIRAAFIRHFVNSDGSIKNSGQTGYALAFTMDLLPKDLRTAAATKFVDSIQRKDWHLATGFIGTPRLLPALTDAGRSDVAYRLLLTDTFPSWLYQVKLGATTMWERWDGWTPEKGFQDPGMNSFNHYAFGSVGQWMYQAICGIQSDSPGYKKISFRPQLDASLTFARASYDSIRGQIASEWKRDGDRITMKFTIPPNTIAIAYLPSGAATKITESSKPLSQATGVKQLSSKAGQTVCELQSGKYNFEWMQ
jgi:alpha-L-rhamnosidase